jgi:DNA-binding NtrC family response regulator
VARESSQLRVLIVDNEPLTCWSLSETLTECGNVVSEAGSGEAAIRALATALHPIDVVLLDYQLPDSGDLTLLSTVRRLSPDSQVILMSAHCTPEIANNALALGAYGVVSKPFDMHDVPLLVQAAAHARPR